jgi:hypothetical protein
MPGGRAKSNPQQATQKWATNTVAAANIWSTNVKNSSGNYVAGLSDFFGQNVSEANVHVTNYKNFANNANNYVNKFTDGVQDAAAQNRWYMKFSQAFGIGVGGGGAPTAPAGAGRVRVYRFGPQ